MIEGGAAQAEAEAEAEVQAAAMAGVMAGAVAVTVAITVTVVMVVVAPVAVVHWGSCRVCLGCERTAKRAGRSGRAPGGVTDREAGGSATSSSRERKEGRAGRGGHRELGRRGNRLLRERRQAGEGSSLALPLLLLLLRRVPLRQPL